MELLMDDRLVYRISDTSNLREVQAGLPGYYAVAPLSSDGSVAGRFAAEWSINKNTTKNKQDLAMWFLLYALNENIQNVLHIQNDYAVPIQQNAFAQYLSINSDLAFMERYKSRIEVFGEDRALMDTFNIGISENVIWNKDNPSVRNSFISGLK